MIDYFYSYYQLNYTEPIMKVKQLHLQNYGHFEDLTIDFAPTAEKTGNITIIVGNNGAGKSQILEAMATGFSWFVNGVFHYGKEKSTHLDEEKKLVEIQEGDYIKQKNIKNNQDNAEIDIKFITTNNIKTKLNLSTTREKPFNPSVRGVSSPKLNELIENYVNNFEINNSLPLVSFYTIDRNVQVKDIKVGYSFSYIPTYAYKNVLNAGSNYSDFFQWFRDNEDIENEKKVNQYIKEQESSDLIQTEIRLYKLLKEKNRIEEIIDDVDDYEQVSLHQRLAKLIMEIDEQYDLHNQIKIRDSIMMEAVLENKGIPLNSIRQAIEYFTNFKNPRIRRQGIPTMIVEKNGEELDVNQLSQGEKSLLALVGDIARRLAILNPSLDNPLDGEGVVMIDEVDLHLHPKWQHDLVDKLVQTFPNVQFILTTHSPHIISDRSDILVYALDDGELTQVPNVYGEDVNTVLTKVFDVDIRDSKIEEKFNEIRRAISNIDLTQAENKIKELEQQLPSSNVELLKCRLMLAQAQLATQNNS